MHTPANEAAHQNISLLVVRLPDTDFKRITEEAIKLYSRI
jgi:hypothetical protein